MLRQRIISVAILLPVGLTLVYIDGWPFDIFIMLIIGLAAWEYARMFQRGGYTPAAPVIIGGSVLLVLLRARYAFEFSDLAASAVILTGMTWHVVNAQHGLEKSGTSFAITLGGVFYLGWLGAYLVSLRAVDDGLFWFLLVLPAVWLADAGAYLVGRRIGRHKVAPRISPGKSWEGYLAGIVTSTLGTGLLALLWGRFAPEMRFFHGVILGLVLSVFTIIGDLGESMLKREFGLKDTSQLIPGHGGVMDRIDSWLWAVTIGYYLVRLLQ